MFVWRRVVGAAGVRASRSHLLPACFLWSSGTGQAVNRHDPANELGHFTLHSLTC